MMKRFLWSISLLATTALGQNTSTAIPVERVAEDARVIDRVAEVSKRDLPRDLLRRIIDEDIDLLRGKRNDGSYQYAGYERFEAGRNAETFSIQPNKDKEKLDTAQIRGQLVYRVILDSPSRRLLVTKNKRIWIDHVDVEYIPLGTSLTKHQDVKVETWLAPGESKVIDFTDIARQATARVFARGDSDAGYGNVTLTLIQARIFDHPDSPYADAVASAKAIQRGLEHSEIPSIRSMAARMSADLQPAGTPATRTIDVTSAINPRAVGSEPPAVTPPVAASADVYAELQSIEDLLTGSDSEKRQGLDRLHQLMRRLRK
jgi:hypothetical protein